MWNMSILLPPLSMLLLPPTAAAARSSFVFINFWRLDPPWFSYLLHPWFDKSLLRWANGEPALVVSYCLTRPLRGWAIVDEIRAKTADRGARYQIDW